MGAVAIVVVLSFSKTAGTTLSVPECSQPVTTGAGPAVVDCLLILQAALGLRPCDPPCVCRPSGGSGTTATDALVCLTRAVGLDAVLQCDCFDSEVVDFSGTSHFKFRQLSALGFCPAFGEVFEADIERSEGDTYLARVVMLEDGDLGIDDCRDDLDIDLFGDFDCPLLVEIPERELTGEQRDSWLNAIRSLEVQNREDPYCETWAFDPCVIEEYIFDGRVLSDYPCSTPHLGFEETFRLREALNALAPQLDTAAASPLRMSTVCVQTE